ncbi:MAG: enoyl-CoA hydratase/isomerase family protein [Myxococcota bacterium]
MSQTGAERDGPIRVTRDAGIAWVTLDAPPMNLLGGPLMGALAGLVESLERDATTRVVVLRSADPDFFVAHGDVETIVSVPVAPVPEATELNFVHQLFERIRRLPQVTIAQIEGFARGGGSELALACDMRFAARGRAVFGQPEIALGILPGAGGTARLARLVGRARASEIILGGDDFTAEQAERYGWINRALPPAELAGFVARLARRIAHHPALALQEAKRAIQSVSDATTGQDLLVEQRAFDRLMHDPRAERVPRMQRFLDRGVQTRAGERTLAAACETLDQD